MIERINKIDCNLFNGLTNEDMERVLSESTLLIAKYNKNDYIYMQGDEVTTIGIVLEGHVDILKDDYNGNSNIIATLKTGSMFAEVFVLAGFKNMPVTVVAGSDCEVIHIDYNKLIKASEKLGSIYTTVSTNLLKIVAQNALKLNKKLQVVSKKTTREKVLEYFYSQPKIKNSNIIVINYNREELANYLCVDRSALSRELSKMQDEGIIKFNKNKFELL